MTENNDISIPEHLEKYRKVIEDTEQEYEKQVSKLKYLSFVGVEGEEAEIDKFCNNDVCDIPDIPEA